MKMNILSISPIYDCPFTLIIQINSLTGVSPGLQRRTKKKKKKPKNTEMTYTIESPGTSALGKLVKETEIEGCQHVGGCNLILKLGTVSKSKKKFTLEVTSTALSIIRPFPPIFYTITSVNGSILYKETITEYKSKIEIDLGAEKGQ